MGGPPAVIIVVRHGARLDAADKQWHLNSPTPYDPPLTYGGWTQCRSLGIRIANLLHDLPPPVPLPQPTSPSTSPTEPVAPPSSQPAQNRKRKQRVVIHSSPFLRCIQTSIAVASGLATAPTSQAQSYAQPQNEQSHTPALARRAAMPQFSHSHSAARPSSRSRLDSPMLAPLPEAPSPPPASSTSPFPSSIPEPSSSAHKDTYHAAPIPKATLRVDAFLGEWLSPDYFEQITPPPGSVMMVKAAKNDLLRREEYAHLSTGGFGPGSLLPPAAGFPGGWGSPSLSSLASRVTESGTLAEEDDLPGPALPLPLPQRDRTSSMSSVGSSNSSRLSGHPTLRPSSSSSNHPVPHPHALPGLPATYSYHPPIPHYAISASDPIPPGYVAHSKDACVDVDYQWDSMREPQNWGDGGEYGEEWGSMHKRFRRGLRGLVEWYRGHDANVVRGNSRPGSANGSRSWEKGQGQGQEVAEDREGEEEEELVIILVTHGAGCNALIGALTNQPALLDVGMANLTMAVRRPPYIPPTSHFSPNSSKSTSPNNTPKPTPRPTPLHSRSSSRVLTLSEEYELRLLNSSEHLRRNSNTSTASGFSSNLPSLPTRPFLNRPYTVASGSDSSSLNQNPFIDPAHLPFGSPSDSLGRASYGGIGSAMGDMFPGSAGLRRTVSVASGSGSSAGGRTYTPRFKGSVGLWSPRRPERDEEEGEGDVREEKGEGEEGEEEDTRGDDMVLNFAEEREGWRSATTTPAAVKEIADPFSRLRIRDGNVRSEPGTSRRPKTSGDGAGGGEGRAEDFPKGAGLWEGKSEKKPEEAGLIPKRAEGVKRRWTFTEKVEVKESGDGV